MTTPVFCASGGSNTSPYETWAKAATSFATALAQASTAGDQVIIQYNAVPAGDAELAVDTVFTTANNISIIAASNDGGTAYTPTAMGTANWIGNSTTNRRCGLGGGVDDRVYVYGLTLRTAGSTADFLGLNYSNSGADCTWENCYFWHGNSDAGSHIQIGFGNSTGPYNEFQNCTFRFGSTSQSIQLAGSAVMYDCTFAPAGSVPTTLFLAQDRSSGLQFRGCDFSPIVNTLVGNSADPAYFTLDRCKLGAGVTILASQTINPTRHSAKCFLTDCSSGDTHGIFGYYDVLGSVVTDSGIYFTSGAAALSWKIATTANASFYMPFETPWISKYNTTLSSITPYLEILRDGSTTAYQDNQVWAECLAKTTSTSTKASISRDRKDINAGTSAANQAAGAGLGSWTGESGTAWSGKIDPGSAITPAENGSLSMRVCVGVASSTVYIDPEIRV